MPQAACSAVVNGLINDPVGFLSQNIVYINMNEEKLPTRRLRRFDAAAQQGEAPMGSNGNSGGGSVYSVYEDAGGGILAHYLPWNFNSGYHIVLNHNSPIRLMFTAALSGCAVGVVWGVDGSARVSHHNIEGPDGTDDAAQRGSLVFTQAALHRNRYRVKAMGNQVMADGFAHVHGVRRSNGVWRFFVQVMRRYVDMNTGNHRYVIAEVGELRP